VIPVDQITLAILAGGHGRRMGTPKANLQIANQPILEYLLDQIAWPGKTLLITAPGLEHPPGSKRFDREAPDPIANEGPLRGILTALQNSTTTMIIIATLDMPLIRAEHLQWGVSKLSESPDCQGVMFRRQIEGRDQIEPFPFACRETAASAISDYLAAGGRSVHGLLDRPAFVSQFPPKHWPANLWTNLNRPEEFQKFVESIG
jgi:molybdenum cofactor guanylyltransferase